MSILRRVLVGDQNCVSTDSERTVREDPGIGRALDFRSRCGDGRCDHPAKIAAWD